MPKSSSSTSAKKFKFSKFQQCIFNFSSCINFLATMFNTQMILNFIPSLTLQPHVHQNVNSLLLMLMLIENSRQMNFYFTMLPSSLCVNKKNILCKENKEEKMCVFNKAVLSMEIIIIKNFGSSLNFLNSSAYKFYWIIT